MKTLQQIIERNDYVRINKAMRERVREIAEIIRNKMDDLDIEQGCDGGVTIKHGIEWHDYSVCAFKTNATTDYFLCARCAQGYFYNLENDFEGYWRGDFGCFMVPASPKLLVMFLNDVQQILEKLDAIETKKVSEIENALSNGSKPDTMKHFRKMKGLN